MILCCNNTPEDIFLVRSGFNVINAAPHFLYVIVWLSAGHGLGVALCDFVFF